MKNHLSDISVLPLADRDKKLFWDYRVREMRTYLIYLVLFSLVLWFGFLLAAMILWTRQHLIVFVGVSLQSACVCLITLLSRRYETAYIYMLPILFLLMKLTELILIYTWASNASLELEDWSY